MLINALLYLFLVTCGESIKTHGSILKRRLNHSSTLIKISPINSISDIRFRSALVEDIIQVAYMISCEKCPIQFDFSPMSTEVLAMQYAQEINRLTKNHHLNEFDHIQIVAYVDGFEKTVVGYVDVDRREQTLQQGFPTPYLSDFVVENSWRSKGVGTSLLSYCETEICGKMWSEPLLHLWVETMNTRAVRFYQRMQYEIAFADVAVSHSQSRCVPLQSLLNKVQLDQFEKLLMVKRLSPME